MSHVFISYATKDIDFAEKIVGALAKNKLDTWVNWKNIDSGEDWEYKIYSGIEEANAFIFLISPDSVAAHMCKKEIMHAVRNGKRIVPILIHTTDTATVPPGVSNIQWIKCRDGVDDFDKAIEKTSETIHADFEWLEYQNLLQNKALAWDRAQKDNSRLLRGNELREAEQQLANTGNQRDPQPTTLQRQYLLKSRRYADYIRRTLTWSSMAIAIIMVLLSVFAWGQRNTAIANENSRATAQIDAENQKGTAVANENSRATAEANAIHQAETSKSLALAAYAKNALLNGDPDLAVALALEAVKVKDPPLEATTTLKEIAFAPGTRTLISGISEGVFHAIFSPDQRFILSGDGKGNVELWDARTGQDIRRFGAHVYEDLSETIVAGLAFYPDGQIAISAGGNDVRLWDINTGKEIRRINLLESVS